MRKDRLAYFRKRLLEDGTFRDTLAVAEIGLGAASWPRRSWALRGDAAGERDQLKKFGLDRTRINEVVGLIADCEGSEPEGERASQSAAQKMEAHNDDGTESHQGEGRPVGERRRYS